MFTRQDYIEVQLLINLIKLNRYGSPGTPSGSMARNTAGIPKSNQNTSPTPAATAWTLRQQQPVSEGYQYSQLSPSRSPSGPTYTQLSSGVNARQNYHTATSGQQQAPHPGKMII